MNKQRRNQIDNIITGLEDIKSKIDIILIDEQDSFENMPEGLQQTTKGQAMEDAIGNLDVASQIIDEVIDALNEAAI